MKVLINADLFGQGIYWDPSTTLAWLMIVVGVMVIVTFLVLSVLIVRTREPKEDENAQQPPAQELCACAEAEEHETETPLPVPVVAEELSLEEEALTASLRYEKSFTAKLIRSDGEVKEWYSELKNELLSYKKVHERTSWKRESFRYGRETVARIVFRGKTLCILLPLDPNALGPQFKVEDVSDLAAAEDTPCLYRIKNDRRVKLAKELIARVAERNGAEKTEREPQDYSLPYEGFVELLDRGLIKRKLRGDDFIPATKEEAAITAETETEL